MREWHGPRVQLCCADLLGACGDTIGMLVAAPVADETAVSLWRKRHGDERWPSVGPVILLSIRVFSPSSISPAALCTPQPFLF